MNDITRIMTKLDSIDDKLSGVVERVAIVETRQDQYKERNAGVVALLSSVVGAIAGSAGSWFVQGKG